MHSRIQTVMLSVFAFCLTAGVSRAQQSESDLDKRVDHVLQVTPLIDGHNDLPWALREGHGADALSVDLNSDTRKLKPALQTDIPRLRAGHVGGQFWSVWIPVELKGPEAVQTTIEQIDLVKALALRYPNVFEIALSAADVRRIHKSGRIASLIGIEGGHQINNSMSVLRQMYGLGARYMTLTHSSNTAWADSATDSPVHHGLTAFGKAIVLEMNRMGMIVDLSHVSTDVMNAALDITRAPVIFSHSSARELNDHPRNVPDDVLRRVAVNGGVVMVNFYPGYISAARNRWLADRAAEQARLNSPPFGGLFIGQPERAKAALAAWDAAHPKPTVAVAQVADHIDHIRRVAGVEHVGIGSDFDGVDDVPQGLEGVDSYPVLFKELMRRGWSDKDLESLAGDNVLRVLAAAENVARTLKPEAPSTATLDRLDAASPR